MYWGLQICSDTCVRIFMAGVYNKQSHIQPNKKRGPKSTPSSCFDPLSVTVDKVRNGTGISVSTGRRHIKSGKGCGLDSFLLTVTVL